MSENKPNNKEESPEPDNIKLQYNRIAEDWRQFNNILWGIPAVAVSIMAGIVVAAYQPTLLGWPRFVLLAFGSLFLFALTAESVKKRLHMNIAMHLSSKLQDSLYLREYKINPHIMKYWEEPQNKEFRNDEAGEDCLSKLFYQGLLKSVFERGAPAVLSYVIFFAAISVGILAVLNLSGIITEYYHIVLPFKFP